MNMFWEVGWTWYPSVIIGFSIWTLLYVTAVYRRRNSTSIAQQVAFHSGTLIGLVALVSPLDELGDQYLFSAHMIQHLLLIFGTAPLWLMGTPAWLVDQIIPRRMTNLVNWLVSPGIVFTIFVGMLWLWHIPSVYEMAQQSEAIHIIEHLLYIGAALMGWWPVIGPETSRVLKPARPMRMLYLFLMGVPCTALAAILTFSHIPLYSFYVTAQHPFGLNALEDQHLGGLLMWTPTHIYLLLVMIFNFFQWFDESDRQAEEILARSLS